MSKTKHIVLFDKIPARNLPALYEALADEERFYELIVHKPVRGRVSVQIEVRQCDSGYFLLVLHHAGKEGEGNG